MRDLITTALDLAGALLLVGGAAVAVAPLGLALALAVAGAGLLAVSYLVDRATKRARRRGASR